VGGGFGYSDFAGFAQEESEKSKEKGTKSSTNALMQKLQEKVRGDMDSLQSERAKLRRDYEESVIAANEAQKHWFCHEMIMTLDALEHVDRERAQLAKTTMANLLEV
jgi:molecular chaperone GrpE (heat shock protein)